MTGAEVGDLLLKVLGVVGGASAIITGLAVLFGRFLIERLSQKAIADHERALERLKSRYELELERHRLSFRKSEMLFEKQIEATNAFIRLQSKHVPLPWRPDIDFDDLVERVIGNAHQIGSDLAEFLDNHGAIIRAEDRQELGIMAARANELSFFESTTDPIQNQAIAEELISDLEEFEIKLLDWVQGQAKFESEDTSAGQ